MNEFGTIGVIISLILGTGIFVGINTIFKIWYFSLKRLVAEWFVCCVIAYFIIFLLKGMVCGILSLVWIIVKVCLVSGTIGVIGILLYDKFKKRTN